MGIDLPESAADVIKKSDNRNAFILNPIFDKKYLTLNEVLNCINHLRAVLLADECYTSQKEHKRYL